MKKRLLSLSVLLTVALLGIFLSVSVLAAEPALSGTWGNLSWTLNASTGELVISGNGQMDSLADTPVWLVHSNSIKTVTIRNGVTSIGDYAFKDCKNLTRVTIPDSVTSIGYLSFWHCTALSAITIPNSCTDVSKDAFSGCERILTATIPGNAIPALPKRGLQYVKVTNGTSIPVSAFQDRASITTIILPNTITEIGDNAFYGCTGLQTLNLPNSVISIGTKAFQHCYKLTSIHLPDAVTKMGDSAFLDCKSLQSVTLPSGLTSIGNSMFENCQLLNTVNFPEGLTNIGNRAFYGCKSLPTVTIPDNVTQIGDFAFSNCPKLTKVVIPVGMQSVSGYAFDTATNIQTAVLPISFISVIPKDNLKTVVFTSGNNIPRTTFQNCKKLQKVVFCGPENQWQNLQKDLAWMDALEQIAFMYHECTWTTTATHHKGDCPHCGASIQNAHTWDNGTVTQQPTHLATGRKVNRCIVCDKELVTLLDKDPKHPNSNWTEYNDTQHSKVCECGETVSENHNYGLWKTLTPATEKSEGQRQKACACGHTVSEVVPVLEHKYTATVVAPTCTQQGYTIHACEGCGDSYQDSYIAATGHSYDNNQDAECNNCSEIREIAAKKGYGLTLLFTVGFGVIGAAGGAIGVLVKKKKRK